VSEPRDLRECPVRTQTSTQEADPIVENDGFRCWRVGLAFHSFFHLGAARNGSRTPSSAPAETRHSRTASAVSGDTGFDRGASQRGSGQQ
jgi:hypothetical protein